MDKVYFAGTPTDMDVRALEGAFPEIKPGDIIGHADVAAAIGVGADRPRYRTVTSAWRKKVLAERGVFLAAVPGTGFRALSEAEKVEAAADKFTAGVRTQKRAIGLSNTVDRRQLDDVTANRLDHLQRMGAVALSASLGVVKAVATCRPSAMLPQRPTPQDKG